MLQRLGLALCSPLLLWLAWPEAGITPFLFIGFIPLLFAETRVSSGREWFLLSWLAMALWNVLGAWWLGHADWIGVVATVFFNALPMAIAFMIFRYVKRKLGSRKGYIALPFLWICIEGLHKYWDFSFPWFTLGYGFAERVSWIQWYEYVGAYGGTFWVWTVNILLFHSLHSFSRHRERKALAGQLLLISGLLVGLPVVLSYRMYTSYTEKGPRADVVVVQPNLDTYTEKFEVSEAEQLQKFIELATPLLDDSVDFLVGPETYLPKGIWEDRFNRSASLLKLKDLCDRYPNLHIVIGATTLRHYQYENSSYTAKPMDGEDGYYDLFNTALFITREDSIQTYHKSKLVAGAEMMPLHRYLEEEVQSLVRGQMVKPSCKPY